MAKQLLSLNVQHDYITLRTPNGNFTTSYGGAKASGKLAGHPTAFRKIDQFVQQEMKKSNAGQAMQKLTDPNVLSQLWPEWNEAPTPAPVEGDLVMIDPRFRKKYPNVGKVTKVAKKYAYVKFPEQPSSIGFEFGMLVKA